MYWPVVLAPVTGGVDDKVTSCDHFLHRVHFLPIDHWPLTHWPKLYMCYNFPAGLIPDVSVTVLSLKMRLLSYRIDTHEILFCRFCTGDKYHVWIMRQFECSFPTSKADQNELDTSALFILNIEVLCPFFFFFDAPVLDFGFQCHGGFLACMLHRNRFLRFISGASPVGL